MSDPFDALHAPVTPIDPDPSFALGLRARLERALSLPKGVAVSTTTAPTESRAPTAAGVKLTPYIAVADARRAIEWYVEVFGGRPAYEPIVMPDGRIGHAELQFGAATIFLSDEAPEIGVTAPQPGQGANVTLHAEVPDVDGLTERAVEAGALLERAPSDNPYGRISVIRDPFGHRWMLNTPPETAAPAGERMRQGDLAYVSLWVHDAGRAAEFFTDVLGWEYQAQQTGNARQLANVSLPHGIFGTDERATLFLCFAVDDLEATLARVREAGGEAGPARREEYGGVADCRDDQGTAFALYQIRDGDRRPPMNGTRPGDLAYVTMEVTDSARARAFYGAVLGWQFQPGRVADGWQVEGVAPMTGLSGGHAEATVVPMYLTDNVTAAVDRVRRLGGTATDPTRQPYGLTAECSDGEGTRFYLGEV